jgi:hypothetical protein
MTSLTLDHIPQATKQLKYILIITEFCLFFSLVFAIIVEYLAERLKQNHYILVFLTYGIHILLLSCKPCLPLTPARRLMYLFLLFLSALIGIFAVTLFLVALVVVETSSSAVLWFGVCPFILAFIPSFLKYTPSLDRDHCHRLGDVHCRNWVAKAFLDL